MLRSDKLTHVLLITTLLLLVAGLAPFFYNTAITSKLFVMGMATLLTGALFAGIE